MYEPRSQPIAVSSNQRKFSGPEPADPEPRSRRCAKEILR
jgi:hypothetical protein